MLAPSFLMQDLHSKIPQLECNRKAVKYPGNQLKLSKDFYK